MKQTFTSSNVDLIQRLRERLTPANLDRVAADQAAISLGRLKESTPVGPFGSISGATRNAWAIDPKIRDGLRVVRNKSKVMKFLDQGTRAHGATGQSEPEFNMRVDDAGNVRHGRGRLLRPMLFLPLTQKGRLQNSPLTIFKDYILRFWVRGITKREYVKKERSLMIPELKERIKGLIRSK